MESCTHLSKSPLHALAALVSGRLPPQSVSEDQWPEIIPLARRHGLGPMLLWVIQQSGIDSHDHPLWEPLESAARAATINYALLKNTHRRVTAALAAEGIPALWLKGIALAPSVYPLPRLRPMVDLDVLVPYTQREAALAIAVSLGFHPPQGHYWLQVIAPPEDLQHHYHLMGGVDSAICLELHYRLVGLEREALLTGEQLTWFWNQTQELSHDGTRFTCLKPEAHLIYLCAHAILRHGEGDLHLLRYFDLHLLVIQANPDWHVVVEQALELRWSYAVERALSLVAQFFDTPLPEFVFSQLRERRPDDEDISRATRLQSDNFRQEKRKLLLAQMPLTVRVGVLFRRIFPPKNYMRHFYAVIPGRSLFPYYAYHWFDAGRKVFRSLLSAFTRSLRWR